MTDKERDILDAEHPRDIEPAKPKTDQEIIADLQATIRLYEANGPMKAVYALNRKVNELADLLNANVLSTLAINDGKDKTFERLKVSWNDMASLATTLKELTKVTGATGAEKYDLSLPFIERKAKDRSA